MLRVALRFLQPSLSLWFAALFVATPTFAADPAGFSAVRRADAARIEAVLAADVPRLLAVLSEDLIYGHSDGRVQNKSEFVTAIGTGRVKYRAFEYIDTKLFEVSPGVISVQGLADFEAEAGGNTAKGRLRFLAVWRQEDDGKWRLLAYQSAPAASATP
ncbi:MAG: nuclear transport factor 2 family protein [Opitutus sp.]|nr:nuclear transport factor 2 family protein [Opitutus sp.]